MSKKEDPKAARIYPAVGIRVDGTDLRPTAENVAQARADLPGIASAVTPAAQSPAQAPAQQPAERKDRYENVPPSFAPGR